MLSKVAIDYLQQQWRGRFDGDDALSLRWHQKVSFDLDSISPRSLTFIGFVSDEGVRRNRGRVGAKAGPQAIRSALANLACDADFTICDLGDIVCEDRQLEKSQSALAELVTRVLLKDGLPFVLGGGHELAWGSFSGIQHYLKRTGNKHRVGIINLDAHFDLRDPDEQANSGTPFRQCHYYCQTHHLPFDYFVLGLNPASNTDALFQYARNHNVHWLTDEAIFSMNLSDLRARLQAFIQQCDCLYLTVCLDVFSMAYAPGVSAPAPVGLHPMQGIQLIHTIVELCRMHEVKLMLGDIAEMNPVYDRDGQTAKLAARLIYELTAALGLLHRKVS